MMVLKAYTFSIVTVCLLSASFAWAQTLTTWNASHGQWNESANWTNGVPTTSIDAVVENGGTIAIEAFSAESATLYLNSGTLDVGQGGSLTTTTGVGVASASTVTSAHLNLLDGGALSAPVLEAGYGNGSQGYLSIQGGTLTMTSTTVSSAIGLEGGAAYVEQSGGTTSYNGLGLGVGDSESFGRYQISGGSLTNKALNEITVGEMGRGEFIQSGASHVTTEMGLQLGEYAGAEGTYTLAGGTFLDTSTESGMQIGWDGKGTFTQSGGTVTTHGGMILAYGSNSEGTYTLSDGNLNNVSEVYTLGVANEGKGTFTQTGGAIHSTRALQIAVAEGSEGTFDMKDGSMDLTGSLGMALGERGDATLIQTGDASITTAGDVHMGYYTGTNLYQFNATGATKPSLQVGGDFIMAAATNTVALLGSDGVFSIQGNFTADSTDTIHFEAMDAAIISIVIGGSADLTGAYLSLDLSKMLTAPEGGTLVLFDLEEAYTGGFLVNAFDQTTLTEGAQVLGTGLTVPPTLSYHGGDGNDIVLLGVIPEPELFTLGLAGLALGTASVRRWLKSKLGR